MGLRADSARPQRVSGSARTDSRRAKSARNPIASHVKFGDDSALNAFTHTQWTAALRELARCLGTLSDVSAKHGMKASEEWVCFPYCILSSGKQN